jgi:hypothetical protein
MDKFNPYDLAEALKSHRTQPQRPCSPEKKNASGSALPPDLQKDTAAVVLIGKGLALANRNTVTPRDTRLEPLN